MKTYICIVCGFVYDEAAGRPEDGIAAGTLWKDVPASWECPDCGVAKADFEAPTLATSCAALPPEGVIL
jgi:rubredoxin